METVPSRGTIGLPTCEVSQFFGCQNYGSFLKKAVFFFTHHTEGLKIGTPDWEGAERERYIFMCIFIHV